jgi:hypothetical protein
LKNTQNILHSLQSKIGWNRSKFLYRKTTQHKTVVGATTSRKVLRATQKNIYFNPNWYVLRNFRNLNLQSERCKRLQTLITAKYTLRTIIFF